ncbi:hypothetical protein MTO96_034420 [Rhipicephalus appendiculatus]
MANLSSFRIIAVVTALAFFMVTMSDESTFLASAAAPYMPEPRANPTVKAGAKTTRRPRLNGTGEDPRGEGPAMG